MSSCSGSRLHLDARTHRRFKYNSQAVRSLVCFNAPAINSVWLTLQHHGCSQVLYFVASSVNFTTYSILF